MGTAELSSLLADMGASRLPLGPEGGADIDMAGGPAILRVRPTLGGATVPWWLRRMRLAVVAVGLTWGGMVLPPLVGATPDEQALQPQAVAELRDAAGQSVGTATFVEDPTGVQVTVQVSALPSGEHGIHIHEAGRCDPPDFMTAGAHFNPSGRQHGLQNPQGPHEGDLPSLVVAADGTGTYSAIVQRVTLVPDNLTSLLSDQGTALVVHAGPDDQVTDPDGNTGGRIACGVIVPAPTPAHPTTS